MFSLVDLAAYAALFDPPSTPAEARVARVAELVERGLVWIPRDDFPLDELEAIH